MKLPIDLGCLNHTLLTSLARLFTDAEMDGLRDRKDKLLSKVYMHRTQFMLENPKNKLYVKRRCEVRMLETITLRGTQILLPVVPLLVYCIAAANYDLQQGV